MPRVLPQVPRSHPAPGLPSTMMVVFCAIAHARFTICPRQSNLSIQPNLQKGAALSIRQHPTPSLLPPNTTTITIALPPHPISTPRTSVGKPSSEKELRNVNHGRNFELVSVSTAASREHCAMGLGPYWLLYPRARARAQVLQLAFRVGHGYPAWWSGKEYAKAQIRGCLVFCASLCFLVHWELLLTGEIPRCRTLLQSLCSHSTPLSSHSFRHKS